MPVMADPVTRLGHDEVDAQRKVWQRDAVRQPVRV